MAKATCSLRSLTEAGIQRAQRCINRDAGRVEGIRQVFQTAIKRRRRARQGKSFDPVKP